MDIVRRKLMLVTVGLKGLRLVSGADGVRGRWGRGLRVAVLTAWKSNIGIVSSS